MASSGAMVRAMSIDVFKGLTGGVTPKSDAGDTSPFRATRKEEGAAGATAPAAGSGDAAGSGEESKAATLVKQMKTAGAVLMWCSSLILLLVTNKQILPGLRYPVFVTTFHFLMCSWLSIIASDAIGLYPRKEIPTNALAWKIVVLALFISSSIVSNNIAFETLALSYIEVIASSTPVVTAIVSLLLARKAESLPTYSSLVPIIFGIGLSSGYEASFDMGGATAAFMSVILRALKAVVAGILMADTTQSIDPLSLLAHTAPLCAIMLAPVGFMLERPFFEALVVKAAGMPNFPYLFLANGTLAYFTNYSNNLVTFYTSPLTLQVLGVGKSTVTVLISATIFAAPISTLGLVGYATATAGVFCYFLIKRIYPGKTLDYYICCPGMAVSNPATSKGPGGEGENGYPAPAAGAGIIFVTGARYMSILMAFCIGGWLLTA